MTDKHEFEAWLNKKLQDLGTDPDVFSSYIKSILEEDESVEEKTESLEGILSEISTDKISLLCKDILEKWNVLVPESTTTKEDILSNVDKKLAIIMEKQAQTVNPAKNLTDEQLRYKQSILAQYGEVCEGDEEVSEEEDEKDSAVISGIATVDAFLAKNDNVNSVVEAEKEKREKAKADSDKKRTQDKVNKEKQKEAKQERKDKEKKRTQKGERRR
ncbi:CCDC43 (predicted) [Pycnogonum litorale]